MYRWKVEGWDPCCVMAESLAKLTPVVMWEAELDRDEPCFIVKEVFMQC